jgi:hypothetical protein
MYQLFTLSQSNGNLQEIFPGHSGKPALQKPQFGEFSRKPFHFFPTKVGSQSQQRLWQIAEHNCRGAAGFAFAGRLTKM